MVTKPNTTKTHSRNTSATNNARGTMPNTKKRKSSSEDPDGKKKKKNKAAIWAGTGEGNNNNNGKILIGQSPNRSCAICFDFKRDSEMFRRSKCKHPFCTYCISKYVATQINENVVKVYCPDPNCSVELKPKQLQPILPKEVMLQWESARCESSIAWGQKTYCPFKNCSALMVNEGGEVVTSAECPSCHRLFCVQCKAPWHAGMTCKEFQALERGKDEKILDMKFLELAKSEMWQRCPRCSIYIQNLGCISLICRCGCKFCYICGKEKKCNGEPFAHKYCSKEMREFIYKGDIKPRSTHKISQTAEGVETHVASGKLSSYYSSQGTKIWGMTV